MSELKHPPWCEPDRCTVRGNAASGEHRSAPHRVKRPGGMVRVVTSLRSSAAQPNRWAVELLLLGQVDQSPVGTSMALSIVEVDQLIGGLITSRALADL